MGPGQLLARFRAKVGTPSPGVPDVVAPLLEQRQSGALVPAAGVRHISHRRFLATFPLAAVGREEQDLYRCVSQAPRGAGVSNFAELIVKGKHMHARPGGICTLRGAGRRGERGLPGAGSVQGMCRTGSDPGRGLTGDPARGGCSASLRRSARGGGV